MYFKNLLLVKTSSKNKQQNFFQKLTSFRYHQPANDSNSQIFHRRVFSMEERTSANG